MIRIILNGKKAALEETCEEYYEARKIFYI
jgi:hypothetical protein